MPEPQAVERVTGKTLHAFFFDRYHLRLIEFTKADTWWVDRHKWNSFMRIITFKFFTMAMIAMMSFSLTSCSSDDD